MDKLKAEMEEQFRIQLAIDQKTTRIQIQNYYQDQFNTMENENKEKLAIMKSKIIENMLKSKTFKLLLVKKEQNTLKQ